MTFRLPRLLTLALAIPALLAPAPAPAQCNPALHEVGGEAGAACFAGFPYLAVARGRFVSIEHTPSSGSPSVVGRIPLDRHPRHLHAEVYGRVWATDGHALYAIDTTTPANPQLLSRTPLPPVAGFAKRLRVRGAFVYVIDAFRLFVFDAANPAAPVLHGQFEVPSHNAFLNDLEVVGDHAYLSIDDNSAAAASLMVLDVSNPAQPVEVRRLGNSGREGLRLAAGGSVVFQLARNSASGALEAWSLANPADPALLSVNTTIGDTVSSDDELRFARTGGISGLTALAYLQFHTGTLRVYNASLTHLNTTSFEGATGLSLELPTQFRIDAYVSRRTGQLGRAFNITSGSPSITQSYLDVPPGWTSRIVTHASGFSAVTTQQDLCVFLTPPGAAAPAPLPLARLAPDPGHRWMYEHLALAPDGTLLAVETSNTAPITSWIIAYTVNTGPTPGVHFAGAYQVQGPVHGLEGGFDASGTRRVFYTTTDAGGGTLLRILNASNLASMTQAGGTFISPDAPFTLRFIPASAAAGTPPRLLVGGSTVTQVISVANINPPTHQGNIVGKTRAIVPGTPPLVWLAGTARARAYSMSPTSAPAALVSEIRFAPDGFDATGAAISGGGALLHIVATTGDLARIDIANPAAPVLRQIAEVDRSNTGNNFLSSGGLAFDGVNLHLAASSNGYAVLPPTFSAPPRADPALSPDPFVSYPYTIVPLCPGSSTLTASFISDPPPVSYQWFKLTFVPYSYGPLANGPTGTGSTISGATTATLTISSPGPADLGLYACQATNACGTGSTAFLEARFGGYANCDNSTAAPALNVADFSCFLQKYAGGDRYANCDGSTAHPILNVADFSCFLQEYAAGCP